MKEPYLEINNSNLLDILKECEYTDYENNESVGLSLSNSNWSVYLVLDYNKEKLTDIEFVHMLGAEMPDVFLTEDQHYIIIGFIEHLREEAKTKYDNE